MRDEDSHGAADGRGWPMRNRERTDAERVGVVNRGSSVFYFPESSEFARYERDEDGEALVEVETHVEAAEESLADAIERVSEETGVESLSDWAEGHLESDGD